MPLCFEKINAAIEICRAVNLFTYRLVTCAGFQVVKSLKKDLEIVTTTPFRRSVSI